MVLQTIPEHLVKSHVVENKNKYKDINVNRSEFCGVGTGQEKTTIQPLLTPIPRCDPVLDMLERKDITLSALDARYRVRSFLSDVPCLFVINVDYYTITACFMKNNTTLHDVLEGLLPMPLVHKFFYFDSVNGEPLPRSSTKKDLETFKVVVSTSFHNSLDLSKKISASIGSGKPLENASQLAEIKDCVSRIEELVKELKEDRKVMIKGYEILLLAEMSRNRTDVDINMARMEQGVANHNIFNQKDLNSMKIHIDRMVEQNDSATMDCEEFMTLCKNALKLSMEDA